MCGVYTCTSQSQGKGFNVCVSIGTRGNISGEIVKGTETEMGQTAIFI